jgi:PAS domain S-box-containing protein
MSQSFLHKLSAKDALDDSSLLRTLIDTLPEQVYVKDTEGRYVLNNLAHVRALGAASPDDVAGKSDFDFYPEELAERYRVDEREVLDSGRPLIGKEEPSVDGEGNERRHSTTRVPLRDGNGEIVGLLGVTWDETERRLAEEALKESEERFRTAFEDAPIGVALVDLDGRRFRVNRALCEMLGYSEEKLCSEKYLEHIHPEDREISSNHFRQTLEERVGTYTLERRYIHAEGHAVWNLTSVSLIQDAQGNPSHFVCLHQDITDRKEVETKLRKSEARLAEAQRIARLGSWEWDVKTGESSWSDETFRIYGYEPKQFVPTVDTLMELVHPDERELVRKNIDAALYEGESYDFEHRIVRPDGEERVVHRQAEVLFDEEEGEPLWMIGTVHDITERKQAEEEIEQLNRQNQLILNSAGEGIYGLDRQGKTTFANPAAARLTGWDVEDLIGRHQHDVMHHTKPDGTTYPSEECPIYAALQDGTTRRVTDEVFWRKDGTNFPVEYVSTPIREQDEIVGAVVVFEDVTERKQTEEALKESEERFQSLVRNATDLITVLEEDGTIRYESPTIERILGYLPEERIGKNAFDYLHPDDEDSSKATFAEALDNPGKVQRPVELRLRHKDGSWRHMETTRTNLLDDSAVKGVVANSRDITERRQALEALRENEERYRAVVEQSAEAIWLFDPDSKQVLESNTAFQEMLGYTAEELMGMTNYDFVTHSRQNIDSAIQRIVRERKGFFGERKYRRKDGTVLDVQVSGNVIPYQGKEVVCAVARNLTERKEAEEALKESEERFRTAFEDAPIGVALVGLDRSHLRVNRAYCQMLGYSEDELLENPHPEIIHPDDREESADRIQGILEEGTEPYALERRYLHADGHVVWSLSNISLIRDSEGEPSHFVCLHEDITERKDLEEELRHQAFYDSLTDLPNRLLFLDRLEHALARAGREGESIAALLVDLDDFKVVNDSLGHDAGNTVLAEVAERLRGSVRPGDTVGRIFGDEFAVLLEAPAGEEEAK